MALSLSFLKCMLKEESQSASHTRWGRTECIFWESQKQNLVLQMSLHMACKAQGQHHGSAGYIAIQMPHIVCVWFTVLLSPSWNSSSWSLMIQLACAGAKMAHSMHNHPSLPSHSQVAFAMPCKHRILIDRWGIFNETQNEYKVQGVALTTK